jgi:hypothetical protein
MGSGRVLQRVERRGLARAILPPRERALVRVENVHEGEGDEEREEEREEQEGDLTEHESAEQNDERRNGETEKRSSGAVDQWSVKEDESVQSQSRSLLMMVAWGQRPTTVLS